MRDLLSVAAMRQANLVPIKSWVPETELADCELWLARAADGAHWMIMVRNGGVSWSGRF